MNYIHSTVIICIALWTPYSKALDILKKPLVPTASSIASVASIHNMSKKQQFDQGLQTELRAGLYIAERIDIDGDYGEQNLANTKIYTILNILNAISSPLARREDTIRTFTHDLGYRGTQGTTDTLVQKMECQYKRLQFLHNLISWMLDRVPKTTEVLYNHIRTSRAVYSVTLQPYQIFYIQKSRALSNPRSEIFTSLRLFTSKDEALTELMTARKKMFPHLCKLQMEEHIKEHIRATSQAATSGAATSTEQN
jgi:hypothetical protein